MGAAVRGPLRSSESAKVGDPHSAGPDAGGAARSVAPLALGSEAGGSPTFTDSEPRRGPFGPLGALHTLPHLFRHLAI
eukprot:10676014-Alexandrium_andersonii.AAC.1